MIENEIKSGAPSRVLRDDILPRPQRRLITKRVEIMEDEEASVVVLKGLACAIPPAGVPKLWNCFGERQKLMCSWCGSTWTRETSQVQLIRDQNSYCPRCPVEFEEHRSKVWNGKKSRSDDEESSVPMKQSHGKKAAHVRAEVSKGQTRDHECHAKNCKRQVPPALLMCPQHWTMVPKEMQAEIWSHYVPGQEKGITRPTRAYLEAMKRVIAHVEQLELTKSAAHLPKSRQLDLFK